MSLTDMSLTDKALRSALEFAIGIAAAGAKLRPPLPFPPTLKPFLRFQKLPPSALAKVRAVVEADAEFLGRLAMVATSELVDEVGMLWLTRPEGWQHTASELAMAGEPQPLDDAGELRREQRRREAAESAAARARVEALSAREQLASAQAAAAVAEAEAQRLATELAAVRTQLAQMERAMQKRAAGATEATRHAGTVGTELAEARAELAAAIVARDAALADRAGAHGAAADIERVRVLLHEALAATRGPLPATRRRQRKPIAVPGGLYGNSAAAAEHLLRTPDVVVLIDGYNVAKLGWPGLSLERQRTLCIEAAENVARRWGTMLHVVFDGTTVEGARATVRRLVRVSFSPEGVIADDVLRAEVAALDLDRAVVVVTNDQAIVADVRAAGANVLSSDAFLAVARR